MGNSLSAQLLKAGLANKKQANKVKQEQYQQKKKQRGKKGGETVSESAKLARKAQAEQKERARQLNQERQHQAAQKETADRIKQLIETAKTKNSNGDLVYNFADGNKIKKIYLNKNSRDQLGKGQLAIVKHKGQYQVVPSETAKKIAELNAAKLIVLNKPSQAAPEDDPYAEFPIPEDLEW